MTIPQLRLQLWLVRAIMLLMPWNICMAVITVFWSSIGMNQDQFGQSQLIFTIVMILCNIATGRWADNHGRRHAAVIGLTVAGFSYFFYAISLNYVMVVVAEVAAGIGLSFASGADMALHRHYCEALGIDNAKDRTRLNMAAAFIGAIGVAAGGWYGSHHLRLVVALTGVQYLLSVLFALPLREVHEPPKHRTALKIIMRDILRDRQLRWYMSAHALSREVTHATIWVFTPLMLLHGVSVSIAGLGWAASAVMQVVGGLAASLARQRGLRPSQSFSGGMTITLLASTAIWLHPSALTVIGGFAIFGFMRDWSRGLIAPLVTNRAHRDHVTTTESVADTFGRLIYAVMVWGCNYVGNIELVYSLALTTIVFTAPAVITTIKLRREE